MPKPFIFVGLMICLAPGCRRGTLPGSIAFSRRTGDYWQIWTIHPDGRGGRQITTSPSDKRYPAWTGDGRRLLYRDNNNQAFVLHLATGQEDRILTTLGMIGSLAESPGGDRLLVVRFDATLKDHSNLWLTSMPGQEKRMLTRDAGLQYDPAWSPDGGSIAYISGHGYQTHELYFMDSDGTNKQRLTTNTALELLPAFSPDGNEIAYVSDVTGDFNIWVIDVDGSNARQLTGDDGIDTRPCWSPCGRNILFVSDRSGPLQLWIMNSDGSDPKQLTHGAPSMEPTWRGSASK